MNALPHGLVLLALVLSLGAWCLPARCGGAELVPPNSKDPAGAISPDGPVQLAFAPYLDLGPLLGHVSSSNALLWAKASAAAQLSIRVGQRRDLSDGTEISGPKLAADTDYMGQVLIPKLEPSRQYYYGVLLDGKPALLPPYPSFTTAPAKLSPSRVRFAFVSCVGYHGYDSAATWADLAARTNFDVLLMLGDNVYANSTDPVVLGQYYAVQRRLPGYADIARRVPQYAIWDNHDYGPEPTDRTAKNKERALQAFRNLWPNPAFGEADNPGVYHHFTRGGVDFFMLDDRYHRSPDNSADDGTKSMLGEKQLAWFKRELLAAKAPVKVLAIGCEWESKGLKNSWATFKREREELFKFIEDNKITGVLLVSGDRHFTAAYQVLGKFIEVTSGPLGSANVTTKPTPEMFFYGGKGKFYCIYDVDTRAEPPKVTLEIYKVSEGLVERRALAWDEVLGVTKIPPLPVAAENAGTARE
jgi:alkaline phosphatase D